jgi:carboxypeptidase T
MKYILFLFVGMVMFQHAGFSQVEKYHRAKIYTGSKGLEVLNLAGICTDHAMIKEGFWIESDFSESELQFARSKGMEVEILIEDVSLYYEKQNENPDLKNGVPTPQGIGCLVPPQYATPSNFSLGSMGGFFTYQEILNHLDNMYNLFPNLITQKAALSNNTIEGRPVYWLKISDNPNIDEPEPEIMYNGVHHAREPASVAQLIMYMYYLLENYNTNAEVKYLVDNSEMYFIPVVNPDGYIYNQTTNPNGGGMWRKNRKNNGDVTFGVDLNRNYGYNWGFDNTGSSPNTNSNTYRGTGPFSEPETQNLRNFCNNRQFRLALNYHTYGNLLIYPWGYGANIYTPDSAQFTDYGGHLTTFNKYSFGTANQTVLYTANGVSDDWMYGEQSTKPKIFAMTPEAGRSDEGFWPPIGRIIDICKENIWQNLHACHLILKYAEARDLEPNYVSATTGFFNYSIKRLGMEAPGTYTVTIVPLGPEITSVGPPKVYANLGLLQTAYDSIAYTLSTGLAQGQIFKYLIEVNNGLFTIRDTIVKRFGNTTIVFATSGNNLTGFTNNGWGTTTQQFYSPNSSITDSPGGNYPNNTNKRLTTQSLNLTDAATAQLSFYAKWEIETNFDYAQVQASTDGGNTWTALCGKYTKTGNAYQDLGQPLYDGFQFGWIREEMPLDAYVGQNILIRYRLISDNGGNEDGFYFDDMKVEKIIGSPTSNTPESSGNSGLYLGLPFPNPAVDYIYVNYSSTSSNSRLIVTDVSGRVLEKINVNPGNSHYTLNTRTLPQGIYLMLLESDGKKSNFQRFTVLKQE